MHLPSSSNFNFILVCYKHHDTRQLSNNHQYYRFNCYIHKTVSAVRQRYKLFLIAFSLSLSFPFSFLILIYRSVNMNEYGIISSKGDLAINGTISGNGTVTLNGGDLICFSLTAAQGIRFFSSYFLPSAPSFYSFSSLYVLPLTLFASRFPLS